MRVRKAVKICSTGLIKARALLGLEENSVLDNASKGLEQSRSASAGINLGFQEARPIPNSNFKFHSGGDAVFSSNTNKENNVGTSLSDYIPKAKAKQSKCWKRRVSTRYPFQFPRKYIKEYLGEPPFLQNMFENCPEWIRKINSENADKHMFEDESGLKCMGLDSFFHMLAQSGCSTLSKDYLKLGSKKDCGKSGCPPLAFKCIKGSGGVVPSTLVGVTRIYPVLYRERHSSIMEGIMAEFKSGLKCFQIDDDEGEKISKLLEQAAEPEVIMADMSLEQLTSFATYQAKVEATRQSEIDKLIEKALEEAGLGTRDVNTLMRVRVQSELVEGQAYAVAGLTPINSDMNAIYFRAKGSTTKWWPLSPLTIEHFHEFDVAAFVIHVGVVHKSSQQKRQWVFVADGSILSHPHELSDALLAISLCSPSVDCDSIVPINYNLVGSTSWKKEPEKEEVTGERGRRERVLAREFLGFGMSRFGF
ncbi:hypothetical protein L1987_21398 [Smallanthus sonchifolius]|uniref:Uncharacterized protein n=1 Tax=Smallanthus sonchifolius TaxID=185202 RepID=A0ACB9IWD8_9ASTR|nr:hypothetical protein L1987_21398 [Smallanthus sonchifolius]